MKKFKTFFLVLLLFALAVPTIAKAADITYYSGKNKAFKGTVYATTYGNTTNGSSTAQARASRFNLNINEGISRYEAEIYYQSTSSSSLSTLYSDYGVTWADTYIREIPGVGRSVAAIRVLDNGYTFTSGQYNTSNVGWKTYYRTAADNFPTTQASYTRYRR